MDAMYPSKLFCVKKVSNINMLAPIIADRSGPIAGMCDSCSEVICKYFSQHCATNDALTYRPCNTGSKIFSLPVSRAAIVNAVPETAIRGSFF